MSAPRVEPRVTWPRTVVSGEPFLVSVDLALVGTGPEPWPYEAEEIEFTCVLDGARQFRVEAVHDASVVVHRFGGSYGPAQFVVTARSMVGRHALRLTPLTSNGIVMGSVEVPVDVHVANAAHPPGNGPRIPEAAEQVDVVTALTRHEAAAAGPITGAEAAQPLPDGRRTALCIISQCDALPPLPGVHEAGRHVVRGLERLGYDCTVLTDPTARQVLEEARRFLSVRGHEPRIVYFSGHALTPVHGDLYLAARDTVRDLSSTTVPFHLLADDAENGAATLFLLDACHSGRAVEFQKYGTAFSSYVVASSAASELSYENFFSQSLADTLELAAEGRLDPGGGTGGAVPLGTFVSALQRGMPEVTASRRQTITVTAPDRGGAEPAFIPAVAPQVPDRTPSLRILLVHGFGHQKHSPRGLVEAWLPPLVDGIRRVDPAIDTSAVELSVAYFADLLRTPRAQGPERPADDGEHPTEAQDLDAADEDLLAEWIAAEEGRKPLRRSSLYATVRRVASLAARSGAAERLFMAGLRELSRYFQDELRSQVTARILRSVSDERPHVLIAHSLGSVGAYEALWQAPHVEVPVLVTTGSPLGLKLVVERLAPHGGRRPPGVGQWFNLAGVGDIIAIPTDGVRKNYEGVVHYDIDTGQVNAHMLASYLAAPTVGGILAAAHRRYATR